MQLLNCMHTHEYIHTETYTCTNTYMAVHIHTYTCKCKKNACKHMHTRIYTELSPLCLASCQDRIDGDEQRRLEKTGADD